MKQAWSGYFELFPDYRIALTDFVQLETKYGLFGYESGTYKNLKEKSPGNYWKIPASWKVIIENEQIKIWQVYCDEKFIKRLLNEIQND